MKLTLLAVLSFFTCMIAVSSLRLLAPRVGLMDHPGGRKDHAASTPLVGGLAIFLTLSTSLIFHGWTPWHAGFLVGISIIVACGAQDDRHEISSVLRLVFQVLAGLVMVKFAGVRLGTVGDLVGTGPIGLWVFVVPMTVFAVCGVINAFNMVDGTDGACGTLAFIAFGLYAWVALQSGLNTQAAVLVVFAGAVLGFLLFNLRFPWQPRARVFLGDAGSTLIGFALGWFAIDLTQGTGRTFPPIAALWVVVIPLCDTVSLMVRRLAAGRSPFSADRQHLHHLLLNLGLSPGQVTLVFAGLGLVTGLIGVGGWQLDVPEPVLFGLFVGLFVVYHLFMRVYWARHARLTSVRPANDSTFADGGNHSVGKSSSLRQKP
ncbi:MAG: undecaprenyl/decaprenyl-phosphate alpha-N-acetylglucosaminyl 1-phosphate transferase [Betaproteobacteria bacterium]|nr:undecaprenyl/decaprenyl-phosphate alpha-N-acetylglucosaminyl 1-phosphate transferase [Betaproteobacteria bacterium]